MIVEDLVVTVVLGLIFFVGWLICEARQLKPGQSYIVGVLVTMIALGVQIVIRLNL